MRFLVKDEGIKNKMKYSKASPINKEYIENAINFVLSKIDKNLDVFVYKVPSPASKGNVYEAVENKDWTAAFFTGMLWLAYELTGDEKYRRVAEIHLESFKERFEKKIRIDTHDLGFLYTLSCVASYKLTKNQFAKDLALRAAEYLSGRFHEKPGIIQAWGTLDDPNQRGRMIIDCMMNLPLLYWASKLTGNKRYYDIAYSHAVQTGKYIVREDASTYHTFYMDVETGAPKYGKTHQGYSDDSCWARGQAWAIYGFVLSYLYTDDWNFVELSKKLANYFLNRLPDDFVPYWDLIFTDGNEERDSSAAAIALCGFLELIRHLPLTDEYLEYYINAAKNIVYSLTENYSTKELEYSNGILLHGVYSKPGNNGVDECCIWGDYFYFEALVRLVKDWKPYW